MEPASIRYKNPGAMWGRTGQRPSTDRTVATNSAIPLKWGSKETVYLSDGKGQGNNIAVFPSFVLGICAQLELWRTSKNYKNKRFADAIAVWSGGNNVEDYIAFVLKRVPGMTRNTIMDDDFWRGPSGIAFLKAQAWHEAGKPYPAPDADWIEAQRRVFGGVLPQPTPVSVAKPATAGGVVVTGTVASVAVAKKAPEKGGGIDWALAIPLIVVALSVAAVVWFVWPKGAKT